VEATTKRASGAARVAEAAAAWRREGVAAFAVEAPGDREGLAAAPAEAETTLVSAPPPLARSFYADDRRVSVEKLRPGLGRR
jgi:hypothetical protein